MAYTYDTKANLARGRDNKGRDLNYTCGANATLLVLTIAVSGATARSGGAPTFNSVAMSPVTGSPATNTHTVEIYYMLSPPTGSQYVIHIPDDNNVYFTAEASSYNSMAGKTAGFRTSNSNTGTAANPVGPTHSGLQKGDVIVATVASANSGWAPSGQTGVSLYTIDEGSYGDAAQYFITTATTDTALSWTFSGTGAWVVLSAVFLEYKAVGGGLRPAAALPRKTSKSLLPTAGIKPAAPKPKFRLSTRRSGGLTSSGGIARKLLRAIAGGIRAAGALITVKLGPPGNDGVLSFKVFKNLTAGLNPAKGLFKKTYIDVSGWMGPAGVWGQTLEGVLNLSGTVKRKVAHALATSFGFDGIGQWVDGWQEGWVSTESGTLLKTIATSMAGGFTSAGGIVTKIGKVLSGGFTSSGDLLRTVYAKLSGVLRSSGNVVKLIPQVLSGVLRSSGAVLRTFGRTLTGGLTSSAGIVRRTLFNTAGGLTSSGVLGPFAIAKKLATTLRTSGNLIKQIISYGGSLFYKSLGGVLYSSGDLVPHWIHPIGQLFYQAVTGGLRTSGRIARVTGHKVSGVWNYSGRVVKAVTLPSLAGGLQSSGRAILKTGKALAAGLTSSGSLVIPKVSKVLAGTLRTSGRLVRYITFSLAVGVLYSSGRFVYRKVVTNTARFFAFLRRGPI